MSQYSVVPELYYDRDLQAYIYDRFHGGRLIVPDALFQDAVKTYQEQYRCVWGIAWSIAIKLSSWDRDESGRVFYSI
ncbi:hypothetical protein [Ktedonobacter racemifer]|uniref:Uncharacterized protein n=1 Tax=Ktedonobacter racemifer DSM 44963 TaxID=485913 RepID=D6U8R4_KTERA|nr:hypothetical protein [Ktedonobacter racemifer]EFH79624.1 hypothetical protein Krac_0102 [Ktedonobacter racemifer DSM 44963]